MIKVLLLGGTGYLGSVFVKRFKKKLFIISPTRQDMNLLDKQNIDQYFKKINSQKFDFILNFCVFQQTGNYLVKNAKLVKEQNETLSNNALYIWKKYYPKSKFVSMGANCAYSFYKSGFSYLKGRLYGGTKNFAQAKRLLANKCKKLNQKFKMNYTILIPGTLIGPGEQLSDEKMHFFNGGLFRAALYKNNRIKKFHFIMNNNVIRELSSVNKVCDEIYQNLKNKKNGIINLIPEYRISLKQFYNLIEKRLKIKKKEDFKKSLFKASISKSYKISVKNDFTKKSSISNKKFLKLFDNTFAYFSKKTKLKN